MDADTLRDRVEADVRRELDRLGSDALLLGLTGGDPTRRAILELSANSEFAARETFGQWAEDEDDPDARTAFERTADQEREHYEQVVELLGGSFEPAGGGMMHAYLRGREDAIARVGAGMIGRSLYSVRAYERIISVFVDGADEATADVFRTLKDDTETTMERGGTLLERLCDDEADWDRAAATAAYVVQLVYDDYADALAELGVDVTTVC